MTVLWKSRLRRHLRMQPTQYAWLQFGRIPKSRSSGSGFSYTRSMQMPHTTASLRVLRAVVGTRAAAAPGSAGTCKQSITASQLPLLHHRPGPGDQRRVTGAARPQETPKPTSAGSVPVAVSTTASLGSEELGSSPSPRGWEPAGRRALRGGKAHPTLPSKRQGGCTEGTGLEAEVPTLEKLLGELSTAPAGPCPEMERGGFGSRAGTHTGCSTVTIPVSSAPLVPGHPSTYLRHPELVQGQTLHRWPHGGCCQVLGCSCLSLPPQPPRLGTWRPRASHWGQGGPTHTGLPPSPGPPPQARCRGARWARDHSGCPLAPVPLGCAGSWSPGTDRQRVPSAQHGTS